LMRELADIRAAIKPHDLLLVVDAMTGQDAVNVAEQFAEAVQFDGVVMTKLDGDARGGAALSVKAVTGQPILYASIGEKLDQFERFHPDRMAQRILGMGDVLTFIEKAEREYDDEREMDRIEAIILSMTPEERRHPEIIKGSRRLRIARGSGTNVQAVNQLVKQFGQMRKLMKQLGSGRMPDLGSLLAPPSGRRS
ncbi:MAG: signal recognition particle protein, partial [Actinobacteria bacterium]